MKQVYFFGAGFSKEVGYPLTHELLNEIKKETSNADVVTQDVRNRFEKFRNSAEGPLSVILKSLNPELVLTVPDLLSATLEEKDLKTWEDIKKDPKNAEDINKWWIHPLRHELVAGELAKLDFQLLVDHFFSMKHAEDVQPQFNERRAYVHNAMANLEDGDIVITINWDTVVERTLMEQGKWQPGDGYSFHVDIECGPQWNPQPIPDDLKKPSKVKVLKLHGSVGWFSRNNNSIYLRYANFLQYLSIRGQEIRDKGELNIGPHTNFIIICPSYLKKFENSLIQSIWDQAEEAILTADQIIVVGYSLPPADIAVRVLLNPLRRRISKKSVIVKVVDSKKATLERWRDFLGIDDKDLIEKKATEFFTEK